MGIAPDSWHHVEVDRSQYLFILEMLAIAWGCCGSTDSFDRTVWHYLR